MKIGIMGGTFDPIHLAHLIAAEKARVGAALDEVWFMPSNVPPHKRNESGASAEQRLDMVRLAIQGQPYFNILDVEIQRGGTSYTVDTIAEVKKRFPEHQFYFIIGADMVQYLPKWYKIERLVNEITFIGLCRPGYSAELSSLPSDLRNSVTMVEMPMIDISSTDIRRAVKDNGSIRFMVPDAVLGYIREKRLYGA